MFADKDQKNTWKKAQEWLQANKKASVSVTGNISIAAPKLAAVYNNDGATSAVSITLPKLSQCVGAEVTVDVIDAYQLAIGPQNGEYISVWTPLYGAGRSLYSATQGCSITLGATVDRWIVRSKNGTWSPEPGKSIS